MEDQKASTVEGEEERSSEMEAQAPEVHSAELEASLEKAQTDPESEGEELSSPEAEPVDAIESSEEESEANEEAPQLVDESVIEAETEAELESAAEEAVTSQASQTEEETLISENTVEPAMDEAVVAEPETEQKEIESEVIEEVALDLGVELDEPVADEEDGDAATETAGDPEQELEVSDLIGTVEEPVAEAEPESETVDEAQLDSEEATAPVEELEDPTGEPTEALPPEASPNGSDGQSPELAEELATDLEAVAPERRVAEPDDGRLWYVVHCYSGYENKVRHNLEQRIETMDMKGKIFDVVVPTEEEMEVREGKRRTVERRVFPGYILVQMIMDEDSWYVVRNTPGVTGFVGMGNDPTPLRPEEVSQIVRRMEADAPRIKVTYDVGQKVRIIDGPFNDFIGTVDDIDMDKAKVRVMVSFFGRETPVELDFLQVEKA